MGTGLISKSIIEIIKAHNGPCLFDEDELEINYEALAKNIEMIGTQLSSIDMKNNKICALVLPNGLNMAVSFLALANFVTVSPLNPNYTKEEFLFFLQDLDCEFIIADHNASNALVESAKQLGIKLFYLNSNASESGLSIKSLPATSTYSLDQNKGDDCCLILHTSGTTSRPKQVQLSCINIISSALNIANVLKLKKADKGLNIMPLFHIHGLIASLLSSIVTGSSLVCTNGFNALTFYGNINTFNPTWITAVPTMYQAILSRASRNKEIINAANLRLLRSSSAAMPVATIEALENVFECPVIEAYGMTEASHQMASNFLDSTRKPGSVGKSAGPDIALFKDNKLITLENTVGEIVIKGSNVTPGYKNNEKANKENFFDGWFKTGDLGKFDEDGFLFISGRIKEIINKGGEKISPQEVDEALMKHEAVFQAVCFSVKHEKLGEDIAAAVVLKEGKTVDQKELRIHLSNSITTFKIPRQILILSEIPKGNTGKIQRIGLAKKLGLEL
ncbi:MAG: AMP-binding protein [Paracoccaceae bacterium]